MARDALRSWSRLAFISLALGMSAAVTVLPIRVAAQQDRPTFREAVDVIELDVRVLTKAGVPLSGLTLDKFEVSIGGKKRRVVSAEFVKYGDVAPASAPRPAPAGPAPIWSSPLTVSSAATGRIYLF